MCSQLGQHRRVCFRSSFIFPTVRRHMTLEQILSCKPFATQMAHERTLFRVAADMADEVICPTVFGLAEAALIHASFGSGGWIHVDAAKWWSRFSGNDREG
jgi:hypothetical protein